jgi:hypothetical protein
MVTRNQVKRFLIITTGAISLCLCSYLAGRLHEISLNSSDASYIEALLENRREFTLFQEYRLYPSAEGKSRWYYRSLEKSGHQSPNRRHK